MFDGDLSLMGRYHPRAGAVTIATGFKTEWGRQGAVATFV